MTTRYVAKKARGFTRQLWRVRAQLEDLQTGESIDLRSEALATKLGEALTRADAGEFGSDPPNASAIARYGSTRGVDGTFYLWQSGTSTGGEPFGRTKSAELAQRLVDVLNRLDPSPLAPLDGRVRAGWF